MDNNYESKDCGDTSLRSPPSINIPFAHNEDIAADILASMSKTPKSFLFYQDVDEDVLINNQYQKQVVAVRKVQLWYRFWATMNKLKTRLMLHFDHSTGTGQKHFNICQAAINHLRKLLDLIDKHIASSDQTHAFEYVQSVLFSEVWLKSMNSIFNALPASVVSAANNGFENTTSSSINREKLSPLAIVKNISSAFLIALFPQDCLAVSVDGSPRQNSVPVELQLKGKECETTAKVLKLSSVKILLSFEMMLKDCHQSDVSSSSMRNLFDKLQCFKYAISSFSTSFKDWKALDSIRMANSLEETFTQSYTTLIAAKVEHMLGNADDQLVKSAEHQVEKIKYILLKILGDTKGLSRIEEICAEVEIANPNYSKLKTTNHDSTGPLTRQESISGIDSDNMVNTTAVTRDSSGKHDQSKDYHTQQSSSSSVKSDDEKTIKYLEMLSQLAGVENERLAHELTLDKHYRLPLHGPSSSASTDTTDAPNAASVKDAKSLAEYLKHKMLAAIADKICNSLRKSNVNSIQELRVGMVIPVRIVSTSPHHKSIPIYSGKILKIIDGRSNTELASISEYQRATNDSNEQCLDITQSVWLEIEFMIEKSIEQYVSLDRVKLAHEENDPIPFTEALADVCHSVALLTPNRPDLQSKVLNAYDPELLHHILEKDVADPLHDLWPILLRVQRAVIALQAEYRVENSEQWLRYFEIAFFGGSLCGDDPASPPIQAAEMEGAKRLLESSLKRSIELCPSSSPGDAQESRTVEAVLPLIPLFLERTVECVEEIQRDMANYYIALLVPVLEKHGHEFLSKRFKMRLQQKLISLDQTASMIMSQLIPVTQFQIMVADLLEAEACPSEGFTLENLIAPSSPTTTSQATVLCKGVIARGILSILQAPVRLDSSDPVAITLVPETLIWDRNRLASIRDLVDAIALECSIVITSKQLLHRYQVTPRESEEIELQHRLDVLLSTSSMGLSSTPKVDQDSSSSSSVSVDLSSIIIEIVNYVQFAIYRTRESSVHLINYNNSDIGKSSSTAASTIAVGQNTSLINYDLKELKDRVEKAIRDVVSDGNPVLALFTKRVYKVLLRAMLDKPYLQKLSSYSLQSKGQERNLSRLIELATKLFHHTFKVHGDIYKALVSTLAASALQQSQETTSR